MTSVNPHDDSKKKSGNDVVKSIVNSYLRRRNYVGTDNFRKSDLVLSRTSMQLVLDSSVDNDASRPNSIVYSTINNDTTLAEQQFSKLKCWITELPEGRCRYELHTLLFPLLCHLYLEGSRGRLDRQSTSKFLKPHQELFVGYECHKDLIDEICTELTSQDKDKKPLIKAFRSCKYEMKVSSSTMEALEKYLATCHAIILQVLQKWFDIEVLVNDSALDRDGEDAYIFTDRNADFFESPSQPKEEMRPEDKEMRNLKEAIRQVRASPTPPPPLLLYTLNNSESVCSAKVSQSGKLLATGYLSSTLKLWSLSESKVNPSITHFAEVNLSTYTPPQTHVVQEQRFSSLRGHSGPVNGVEFLHEAEVILSVSHDCTMRAWKLSDYSPAAIYRGHNHPLWCVAASTLGIYIATGSHDCTARLWNLDRTYPLRIFAGHCHDVNCVQFHPNGNYLATGSADRSVRLWSVTDGKLVRVYGNGSGSVLALAFSPDGQHLASAGDDKRVRVWELASGGLLAELKTHLTPITAIHWSRDSTILASASLDGTVLVWNSSLHFKPPNSESTVNPAKYTSNCTSLLSLQCLPRGNLVAVGTV